MADGVAGAEAALQLDPTSRTFDPKAYIRHIHADVTHVDIENTLLRAVGREAEDAAEALKEMIRDNMGTFIGCKEAMDVMYANDTSLFTGDAVDPIADVFQSTLEEGEALVAPTVELFEELWSCKQTKEMLEKLMVVWNVPGAIYEYCGVRVAQRRSAAVRHQSKQDEDTKEGEEKKNDNINNEGEEDNEDSSGGSSSRSYHDTMQSSDVMMDGRDPMLSASGDDVKLRSVRGALEEVIDSADAGNDYVLNPGEELVHWYGTPLARRRTDHSHHHHRHHHRSKIAVGGCSNYEAAVLSLRRAMLYLEENYDLEHAVFLGVDAGDYCGGDDDREASRSSSAVVRRQEQKQTRQQSSLTLTYRYAMSLLRAALYLSKMMAQELRHASAADTVLIEDTLSSMMDCAIAAVKLRHFCWTAQNKLQLNTKPGVVALSGLRQELRDGGGGGGYNNNNNNNNNNEEEEEFMESPVMTPSFSSYSDTEGEASGITAISAFPSNASREQGSREYKEKRKGEEEQYSTNGRRRLEHPVEYYVRITRAQHAQMMEDSALSISRDANEWQLKYMPREAVVETSSVREKRNGSRQMWLNSFAASAGLSGDAGDSFVLYNTTLGQPLESMSMAENSFGDSIRIGGFDVDVVETSEQQHAEAILEAFNNPGSQFPRFTTFSIGRVEMSRVLECSAKQLAMYSSSLLQQVMDCIDTPVDISSCAAAVNTFASRLFVNCVDNMELVLVSYWGGIAAAVHAGMFDFILDPRSALYRMINGPAVLGTTMKKNKKRRSEGKVGEESEDSDDEKGEGEEQQQYSPPLPSSSLLQTPQQTDEIGDEKKSVAALPPLMYIPTVREGSPSLRHLSVELVRRGVKTVGEILYALFLSSINRTLLRSFVHTMAAYRVSDVANRRQEDEEEYIELHAAILVEVILVEWEKSMTHLSESVRRMKIVIGENSTSTSIVSEEQAQEVGELLEDLEQLRSNIFRCYVHGVGMLAKAYVTLLPSLRQCTPMMNANRTVSTRVSRDFVSSVLVNKLLNLLSVVIDRTAPFLQRFDEVYDGIDLFAAKTEHYEEKGDTNDQQEQEEGHQQRARVLRRKLQKKLDAPAQLDTVTAFMANFNSKMVFEHVEEQEEMLLALVANIILVFIDTLHQNCQRVSLGTNTNASTAFDAEDAIHIDSLADALCLPNAVVPIVINELVSPCILNVVACLKTEVKTPQGVEKLRISKEEHFRVDYISQVEDQCQLVVDAMLSMLLARPQQRITREVRAPGFIMPMMDWQRVSAHTAGAVRPYIADSILLVVQVHEELQYLRQPLLASAVTQRLVSHFAVTFVTALTSDGNVFEVSLDCSSNFLTHGLLLIEAEARTILSIADTLVDSVVKRSGADSVIPELNVARELLRGTVTALQQQGTVVCEALSARKPPSSGGSSNNNNNNININSSATENVMTPRQREARCEAMVRSAIQRLRSVVEAIVTHVDDATVSAAFKPLVGSVTGGVAERLARRKENYRRAHSERPPVEKKHVRVVRPQRETAAAATASVVSADVDKREAGEVEGKAAAPTRSRRVVRKKAKETTTTTTATINTPREIEGEAALTPRDIKHASVLQLAAKQEGRQRGDAGAREKKTAKQKRVAVRGERTVDTVTSAAPSPVVAAAAAASARSTSGVGHGRRFKRSLAL